jgi:heat shock protein HtpX
VAAEELVEQVKLDLNEAHGQQWAGAAVAVTQGLLHSLSTTEVEAVIAHELAHIKNRDILISSIAASRSVSLSSGGENGFHSSGWARKLEI